jgi:hypothetical protein
MSQHGGAGMVRRVVCFVALGATIVLGAAACGVEVGAGYGGYDGDAPPDAYIATTEPVYFEGRATYWYGGQWYYRDGGRWNHYGSEPSALYQRRTQSPPARLNYEARGRSAGNARPTGGWRGNRR